MTTKTTTPRKYSRPLRKIASSSESLSLEELAAEQNVSPMTDLDAIGNLWPANDDLDEMLAFLLAERAARRCQC